jgi:predicted dehydrogenase
LGPDKLTVGLVGAGRWGRRLATAFRQRGEIAAICHLSRAATRSWAGSEFPEATVTYRLSDLLGDSRIDAIAIATPISTHAEIAARCLSAGKHVFVEKPLATSTGECAALVEEARRRGLVLMTGHVFLYDPVFAELRRVTEADPVKQMKTSWHKYGTFQESLIWNLMSHELALGIGLFGREPVGGRIVYRRGFVSETDASAAELSFGGGNDDLLVEIDRCAPANAKSVTVKTRSGKTLLWSGDTLFEGKAESMSPIFTRRHVENSDPLSREVETFERAVKLGEPPLTDGVFGLAVVAAVELMRN